jgi:hypothetical protein
MRVAVCAAMRAAILELYERRYTELVKTILYVYAVTREAVIPDCEAVDRGRRFGAVSIDGLSAVFTPVSSEEFSQEVIDQRAGDLEWLGAIGYRHQQVVAALMQATAIVPLRAFTLFGSEESLRNYLHEQSDFLEHHLDRLAGKQEWTLRVEIDPERWSESLSARVPVLQGLEREIESAPPGKAFLLRKKLDEEKKRVSHEAEDQVVSEIERVVLDRLRCETVAETRERRSGGFPQINVLIDRDEDAVLQELRDDLTSRYEREGVAVVVTGPWPPYTFAGRAAEH